MILACNLESSRNYNIGLDAFLLPVPKLTGVLLSYRGALKLGHMAVLISMFVDLVLTEEVEQW